MALSWLNRLLGRNDLEVLDHYRDTDPGEGDSKVLSEMLKRNADLPRPRHTIFYLYFTSAESAFTAAERLLQMGYEANAAKKNPSRRGPSVACNRREDLYRERRDNGARTSHAQPGS